MSRIGKQPVQIPSGVEVKIEGSKISVKGPKGELSEKLLDGIEVSLEGDVLNVSRQSDSRTHRAYHGLIRALLANDVLGVSTGFEKNLEIVGVGYRANTAGNKIVLNVGYSHQVEMEIPEGISAAVADNVKIKLQGFDKAKL